jgi:hypothetical protein
MAWLAYGIKAQRLPGDIGLDTGKEKAVGALEICGLRALWTIGIRENSKSEDLAVAMFAEVDSQASRGACRKTQINALLVLSLGGT